LDLQAAHFANATPLCGRKRKISEGDDHILMLDESTTELENIDSSDDICHKVNFDGAQEKSACSTSLSDQASSVHDKLDQCPAETNLK